MKEKKGKKAAKNNKNKIRSMTGFGKGQAKSPFGTMIAEVKTFNHKHLSISCTAFEGLFLLEERVKEIIGKSLVRGKAFIRITKESTPASTSLKKVKINEKVVKEYLREINGIQKKFSLKGNIQVGEILSLPGVVEQINEKKEDKMWPAIKKATEAAVRELLEYREKEGAKLAKDLLGRLKEIAKALNTIKKAHHQSIKEYRKRLTSKIEEVADHKNSVDKMKIEEEVALFARNCDIEEEIVRLGNHVEASLDVLEKPKADVGKKLDFIAQEMHREVNTIGAKTGEYKVSNLVIGIKSEIEKIREQLSNIE